MERTDERMVVNNVDVFKTPVCMSDVADLVDAAPEADTDCPLKREGSFDRTGAVPGREEKDLVTGCLLYTSPSPRDRQKSRMPSSA